MSSNGSGDSNNTSSGSDADSGIEHDMMVIVNGERKNSKETTFSSSNLTESQSRPPPPSSSSSSLSVSSNRRNRVNVSKKNNNSLPKPKIINNNTNTNSKESSLFVSQQLNILNKYESLLLRSNNSEEKSDDPIESDFSLQNTNEHQNETSLLTENVTSAIQSMFVL